MYSEWVLMIEWVRGGTVAIKRRVKCLRCWGLWSPPLLRITMSSEGVGAGPPGYDGFVFGIHHHPQSFLDELLSFSGVLMAFS